MTHLIDDLNNPEVVSVIDDVSFWSAPFGIRLLDVVRYRRNMKVLDIGFGSGFPLIELSMRLGNSSKVYGIDPWKAGIERVRKKIRIGELSNVEVVEGQAEDLPFDDNYFDLIVSNNGINNVADLERTIEECSRTLRSGGQFVFTFNTDKTFTEFYNVYRDIMEQHSMQNCVQKLSDHIYSKRKPLSEFIERLKANKFEIVSIDEDAFSYRFSDATAMLNHLFMKMAFIPSWKEIVPEDRREVVFQKIEEKLNTASEKMEGFSMQVPFVTLDCCRR